MRHLAFLCALAACMTGPVAAEPAPHRGVPVRALQPRPMAAELNLKDLDGKPADLARHRGQVVLVNFWATWCPPCARELPSLERLWLKLKGDGLAVWAVNLGEDARVVSAFAFTLEPEPTFRILPDRGSMTRQPWGVRGLPTTYVIDRQGRIAYQALGEVDFESADFVGKLRALLAESGGTAAK